MLEDNLMQVVELVNDRLLRAGEFVEWLHLGLSFCGFRFASLWLRIFLRLLSRLFNGVLRRRLDALRGRHHAAVMRPQ